MFWLLFMTNCFQNPIILDPTSDKDRVQSLLKRLLSQMDELQKRAFTYKSYQKNFKVIMKLIAS